MLSCKHCEIFKNGFFREQLWRLHLAPIRYPLVTAERENNKIRLQVKFTAFTSLRKK